LRLFWGGRGGPIGDDVQGKATGVGRGRTDEALTVFGVDIVNVVDDAGEKRRAEKDLHLF